MTKRAVSAITLVAAFTALAATGLSTAVLPESRAGRADPSGLVVHEWGTFTTVAGDDGHPVDWLPLSGPVDLPCFVERFWNVFKGLLTEYGIPASYEAARTRLWGKVRMETPVLYFYAPDERSVKVRIDFRRGLMTEWYPKAVVTQPNVDSPALRSPTLVSAIEWPKVTILPLAAPNFPMTEGDSHYYAARDTEASPLLVGNQLEKFLFYRGVGGFDVPLAATMAGDETVRLQNLGTDELPSVVLFENRGGRVGYRVHGSLRGDVMLDLPPLDADIRTLRQDLEALLVRAGLYPIEATAMLATWRDSWFEEGTRVFYIMPSRAVDEILPLTIAPSPEEVARVFVGRLELITPAWLAAVDSAIARNDSAALEQYGRFLGPAADRLLTGESVAGQARIRSATAAAFASSVGRAPTCR